MYKKLYLVFSMIVGTFFTIYIYRKTIKVSFSHTGDSIDVQNYSLDVNSRITPYQKTSDVNFTEVPQYFPDLDFSHMDLLFHNNNTGNIPDIYFMKMFQTPKINDTCATFPELFDLKFNNDYWQKQETSNGNLYLFNAFVDKRNNKSLIRILSMYSRYMAQEKLFCQIWYKNSYPVFVESEIPFWMFQRQWGADSDNLLHPYLITCPLDVNKEEIPMSVSLVQEACNNASNNLKVFYKSAEKKKNFVVCVKGLSFPNEDKSARITEWIELLNILGAEKIHFYEFSVHPYTKIVLDYYTKQEKIEVTPIKLAGDYSNLPFLQNRFLSNRRTERRLQEVISFNDCLYKHIHEFDYIVLLDIDEVIIPVHNRWKELIETLKKLHPNKNSYLARNVYFLDSYLHQHKWFGHIPKYLHILQHVYKAKNYTKKGFHVKGFHDTKEMLALHNHYPLACLNNCSAVEIDTDLAHLQHYRADCEGKCETMKNESVVDFRVWNFKDELMRRVEATFRDLNVIKK